MEEDSEKLQAEARGTEGLAFAHVRKKSQKIQGKHQAGHLGVLTFSCLTLLFCFSNFKVWWSYLDGGQSSPISVVVTEILPSVWQFII